MAKGRCRRVPLPVDLSPGAGKTHNQRGHRDQRHDQECQPLDRIDMNRGAARAR
jgi:hypothetical protein